MAKPRSISGENSPRLLVPLAIVSALTALIDDLPEPPDLRRARLRTLRTQLCALYRVRDPGAATDEVALAQELAEQDGIPLED